MNATRIASLLTTRTCRRLAWAGLLPATALVAVLHGHADSSTDAAAATSRAVERGRYLTTILACGDCHTPWKMGPHGPEPDPTRMLSGHPESEKAVMPSRLPDAPWAWVGSASNTAFAGPWGISYTANLTPDEDTGIGSWTEEIFVKALRTGKHWGQSRPILPPMPWLAYSRMTDDDLAAIFAYLRAIPAVKNRVPDSVPAGEAPAE
jgi:mono/diheme cytochrome c family protein